MKINNSIISKKPVEYAISADGQIDLKAICIFAAIGFFLDDDTYWTQKKILKPATHNHLDKENKLISSSFYFKWHYTPRDITFEQALEEFTTLFETIIEEYSNTEFAIDAKFKIDLINEILAGKEMYIARYYLKKNKWIPALNRYKTVISNYNTTIYTEEALHRLVEINYRLGLIDESKKFANTLGYNYQSSDWYKNSYKVFNKNYRDGVKELQKDKKKKIGLIKRFKGLFE